jgi:Zn-dependent protease
MLGGLGLSDILIYLVAMIISIVLHEFMHGYVAFKLGDATAQEYGRLSFNPLKSIDPFMTIILPAITLITIGVPFLAAKPVPFNPARLKFDDYGAAMVAAAGPITNIALAIIFVLLLNVVGSSDLANRIISDFIGLNVALFVFNLVPIPPLDGSRILYAFAPESIRRIFEQVEPYGFFIIFGLFAINRFSLLININHLILNVLSRL